MRIGPGYDVHRLVEGRKLILGGVKIPYEKGLLGHSDADVLTHSVADSILGALAMGDIGKHFHGNDMSFKDIDSMVLLKNENSCLPLAKGTKINLFGYNAKYGISGKPIGSVTYKPQSYEPQIPLYQM